MKLKNIRLLIFDFDGTLADTKDLYLYGVASQLENYGYEFKVLEKKFFLHFGKRLEEVLKALGIKKEIQDIRLGVNKYVQEEHRRIKACPEIHSLKLLKNKYKLVLVSNSITRFVNSTVKNLKINYFDKIIGGDLFESKEQALKKLFKEYSIKPEQAVYIGDRGQDCDYARKAKCHCILISNKCSWNSKEALLLSKPDFILESLKDIGKVINYLA